MTPEQRKERARQAEQALEFVQPAFDTLTQSYLDKIKLIASSTPWEADKITALATALRTVEVAREQIELLITDGKEAQMEMDHARKFVEMSASDRRLIEMAARYR